MLTTPVLQGAGADATEIPRAVSQLPIGRQDASNQASRRRHYYDYEL